MNSAGASRSSPPGISTGPPLDIGASTAGGERKGCSPLLPPTRREPGEALPRAAHPMGSAGADPTSRARGCVGGLASGGRAARDLPAHAPLGASQRGRQSETHPRARKPRARRPSRRGGC